MNSTDKSRILEFSLPKRPFPSTSPILDFPGSDLYSVLVFTSLDGISTNMGVLYVKIAPFWIRQTNIAVLLSIARGFRSSLIMSILCERCR